jgi:hypothetical protein
MNVVAAYQQQFCLLWLLTVLCSGMSHTNSGRNFWRLEKIAFSP